MRFSTFSLLVASSVAISVEAAVVSTTASSVKSFTQIPSSATATAIASSFIFQSATTTVIASSLIQTFIPSTTVIASSAIHTIAPSNAPSGRGFICYPIEDGIHTSLQSGKVTHVVTSTIYATIPSGFATGTVVPSAIATTLVLPSGTDAVPSAAATSG